MTSSPIQSGFSKDCASSASSISATISPSFSPKNSSTSQTNPLYGILYRHLRTSGVCASVSSILSASSSGISYSNSSRLNPRVCPLTVRTPRPPSVRTRTVHGEVCRYPCRKGIPCANPRHASFLTRNFRSISTCMFLPRRLVRTFRVRRRPRRPGCAEKHAVSACWAKPSVFSSRRTGSVSASRKTGGGPVCSEGMFLQALAKRRQTVYVFRFRLY